MGIICLPILWALSAVYRVNRGEIRIIFGHAVLTDTATFRRIFDFQFRARGSFGTHPLLVQGCVFMFTINIIQFSLFYRYAFETGSFWLPCHFAAVAAYLMQECPIG